MQLAMLTRALLCLATAGVALPASAGEAGPAIARPTPLTEAIDPERFFTGDPVIGEPELVLTVTAYNRDNYNPAYSLAVALRCEPKPGSKDCEAVYRVRILRDADQEDGRNGLSATFWRTKTVGKRAVLAALDRADVAWLEADVYGCPGGIEAYDAIRKADWNPDLHYAMTAEEDRDLIMHPALIRVRMSGDYTTSRYDGWVLAAGVPKAVARFVEAMEPCWKPVAGPKPWRR